MNAKHRLATAFLLVGALTASSLGASQVNSKEHQCTKHDFKCTAAEGKCTGDFMTKEALCYNVSTGERTGSCCQFPYHCYNGKCLLSNENYDCKDDNECFSSYYGTRLLACVSERCVPKYNAGDKCSGDDSCYGEMVCEKDTCKGIAEGGECIGPVKIRTGSLSKVSGFECAHNLYCLNATCVKSAATGETCNANPDSDNYKPCEESLTCNNEVCTKRYSIQLGSSCTVSKNSYYNELICTLNNFLHQTFFLFNICFLLVFLKSFSLSLFFLD